MSGRKTSRKQFKGIVVGSKMQNAVRVQVDTSARHPVYKKVVNKRKIFLAHTEKELKEGDSVTIRESRPYSKNVKWVVVEEQ